MAGPPAQRIERVASEVRAVLGEVLARDEIKDPRVRGAGLITVTHVRISGDLSHAKIMFTVHGLDGPALEHVRVSGDLRHARAHFTVHGVDDAALERVRAGLDHASGYFRRAIAARLRTKVSPHVTFVVDRVFDKAMRIDALLHSLGTAAAAPRAAGEAGAASDGEAEPPGADDEPE
jgi:ribosome-binding factor A